MTELHPPAWEVRELAELCHVSERTARRWIASGLPPMARALYALVHGLHPAFPGVRFDLTAGAGTARARNGELVSAGDLELHRWWIERALTATRRCVVLEERLARAQTLTASANDALLSSADDLARLVETAERRSSGL